VFPPVDLKRYRLRAEVDWIDVRLYLDKAASHREILRYCPAGSFAQPVGTKEGELSVCFDLRIQDPSSWTELSQFIIAVGERLPFARPPEVTGIEVALDARSPTACRDDLVLFAANYVIFSDPVSKNCRILRSKPLKPIGLPPHHGTLSRMLDDGKVAVVGDKEAPRSQRCYVKATDGNGRPLPVREHRARFENTYRGKGLNVLPLAEWCGYNFKQFASDFHLSRLRADLARYEAVLARADNQLGSRHRRKRIRLSRSPLTRADTVLNQRISDALRELTRRWSGGSRSRNSRSAPLAP
jgi:hypothetical protein